MRKFQKLAATVLAAVMMVSAGAQGDVRVFGAQEEGQLGKLSYDVKKPVELVAGEAVSFQVEKVEKNKCYFTFHLNETSKVEVGGELSGESTSNLAWHFSGVYQDALCSKKLTELDALDAGDYFVVFECDTYYLHDDQTLTVLLTAKSWGWGEGVDAKTVESAVALTVGEDCGININEKYAARFVEFKLENDTVLGLQGKMAKTYVSSSTYMSVYDAKGVNITKSAAGFDKLKIGNPGEWSEEHKITLKAGTYYFGITWVGFVPSSDFTFRTEILKETDNTPPAKPTKLVCKAGAAKVTGNGEKNATVFVRVGDKIYTGNISSKGTFSVKTAKLVKGDVVYVWVMDKALNQGKYSKVTVK